VAEIVELSASAICWSCRASGTGTAALIRITERPIGFCGCGSFGTHATPCESLGGQFAREGLSRRAAGWIPPGARRSGPGYDYCCSTFLLDTRNTLLLASHIGPIAEKNSPAVRCPRCRPTYP